MHNVHSLRLRPVRAAALGGACAALLGAGACQAAGAAADDLGSRQLLVLFDPADSSAPSPAALVAAVTASARLPASLLQPIAVQPLLDDVPADTATEMLDALSPRERLERYVVLTYANAAQADAARRSLEADKQVVSVEPNLAFGYSADPDDKFWNVDWVAGPAAYQWGMNDLGMSKAWDKVRGYAYIAAIDSGVSQTTSGVTHADLVQNFREQLSRNFRDDGTASPYEFRDALGHGSHVTGIMSATPQYGPFSNGQVNTGVAGACWTCSLVMLASGPDVRTNEVARALTFAADHGLQAVNMSFGDGFLPAANRFSSCATAGYSAICTAIAHARDRDVVLVGASGNGNENRVQFPARSPDVIAVGGIKFGNTFWDLGYGLGTPCTAGMPGEECGSNYGPEQAVVAPALDVLSTIGLGLDDPFGSYNDQLRCGDKWPAGQAVNDTYGTCTGTSMAAPHVTGLVGLLRSANPLLSRTEIRNLITANADPCAGNDPRCGAGVPNATASVEAAFGYTGAANRLTPLFAFYSTAVTDHFYTSVPQMAVAALNAGGLWPQPPSPYNTASYGVIGTDIPNYLAFPQCSSGPCPTYPRPKAIVSVFTTHNNPFPGGDLTPLYRYSFHCRYNTPSCALPPSTALSHVYATNANPMSTYLPGEHAHWTSLGFKLDGIEGYVFPKEMAQPIGTVKLCRKFDATRSDYVLFPGGGKSGTDCSAVGDGHTGGNYSQNVVGSDWIGWVFPVGNARPVCSPNLTC